ncbi:hypothetical protein [Actinoplanes couchii]|nr:hypothetical protein [Actinoplanes couchii]MDR6319219.1 NAD(P)-dependent dehydrogenase (short-subunit alcohol dehydrogenase family) [Actinoplanes couchii]
MAGLVLIGAGPGIGRSVAARRARFGREGLPVALIARTPGPGVITADCTDQPALRAAPYTEPRSRWCQEVIH